MSSYILCVVLSKSINGVYYNIIHYPILSANLSAILGSITFKFKFKRKRYSQAECLAVKKFFIDADTF